MPFRYVYMMETVRRDDGSYFAKTVQRTSEFMGICNRRMKPQFSVLKTHHRHASRTRDINASEPIPNFWSIDGPYLICPLNKGKLRFVGDIAVVAHPIIPRTASKNFITDTGFDR